MTTNEYDPLEKLTLLAPHAVDWRRIPSGYQRLTPSDVAARLGLVSRGASLIGRIMVADQGELFPDLLVCLRTEVVREKIRWPTNKKTLLPELAKLALMEVIDHRVCPKCDGAVSLPALDENDRPTGKFTTCVNCDKGRVGYTEYKRYTTCGIHQEEWRRKWSWPYIKILAIAKRWANEATDAMA